jgi:hypothetical protein
MPYGVNEGILILPKEQRIRRWLADSYEYGQQGPKRASKKPNSKFREVTAEVPEKLEVKNCKLEFKSLNVSIDIPTLLRQMNAPLDDPVPTAATTDSNDEKKSSSKKKRKREKAESPDHP